MLTDKQIAKMLDDAWCGRWAGKEWPHLFARAIEAEVRKESEAAVLAEREACAQLADEICRCCFPAVACDAAESVAEEIRARTQPMHTDSKPQDTRVFDKHVAGPDGWAPWTNPVPTGYLLKCCDCGLVHEMEFTVVKFKDDGSDVCAVIEDSTLVVAFRARREQDAQPMRIDAHESPK